MKSNCLFEAVKAKIKNPKNIQIFKLPKGISKTTHFVWKDGNFYYHAYNVNHSKNKFFFECKIKKIPDYVFESFILNYIEFSDVESKIKIAKKCAMKIIEYKTDWQWSLSDFQDDLPSQTDIEFFEKVMKCSAKFKICINGELKTTGLEELKSQTCDFEWKMVDLFDPDFDRVYRDHKVSKMSDILTD